MKITQESTGTLTATIHITVEPADYQDKVTDVLKQQQRKASVPGFRPGKVPFGMIKKMYGIAVKADEVNKIISESLNQYIQDSQIKLVGQPIPNTEKERSLNLESENSFDFYFDIGLSPDIKLELQQLDNIEYLNIKPDDELLNETIENYRKKFGTTEKGETVEENDQVKGSIQFLDQAGELIEEAVETELSIETIQLKTIKQKFIGKTTGQTIDFNPLRAIKDEDTVSKLLRKAPGHDSFGSDYRFTILEIPRKKDAELNETFYEAVFPDQDIKTESDFRKSLTDLISRELITESDRYFFGKAVDQIIKQSDIELPDEFLKKWIRYNNQDSQSTELPDDEYAKLSKSFKWQLIETHLINSYPELEVKPEDIKQKVKSYLGPVDQDLSEEMSKQLDSWADRFLQNEDEVKRVYNQLLEQKLIALFKEHIPLKEKEIPYGKFLEKVTKEK